MEETNELCAICLEKITFIAKTNVCMHQFCFNCIAEWVQIKSECPICKKKIYLVKSLSGIYCISTDGNTHDTNTKDLILIFVIVICIVFIILQFLFHGFNPQPPFLIGIGSQVFFLD